MRTFLSFIFLIGILCFFGSIESLQVKKTKMKTGKEILALEGYRHFILETVNLHNRLRKKHLSQPLKINHKLQKQAQQFAEQLAQDNKLYFSEGVFGNSRHGQSLYKHQGDLKAKEMVLSWYDEGKKYNYKKPGHVAGTEHFSQLLWANTKEIGIGIGEGRNHNKFVVINYFPLGNILDQYPNNIKNIPSKDKW